MCVIFRVQKITKPPQKLSYQKIYCYIIIISLHLPRIPCTHLLFMTPAKEIVTSFSPMMAFATGRGGGCKHPKGTFGTSFNDHKFLI